MKNLIRSSGYGLRQLCDEEKREIPSYRSFTYRESQCHRPPGDRGQRYAATQAGLLWAHKVGATVICGDGDHHPYQRGTARAVDELGGPTRLAGGLLVP